LGDIEYDEDADGFQFTRTKSRRKRKSATTEPEARPPSPKIKEETPVTRKKAMATATDAPIYLTDVELGAYPKTKKKGKRTHTPFSTPDSAVENPQRRSKRISNERAKEDPASGSPVDATATAKERALTVSKRPRGAPSEPGEAYDSDGHSATKIALPFADTPVIRRNKEMRQGKAGKGGERRSSLGMRGRRASSLIDSGNSNGGDPRFSVYC
jgi:kinetochore protein Mis13/DSN1